MPCWFSFCKAMTYRLDAYDRWRLVVNRKSTLFPSTFPFWSQIRTDFHNSYTLWVIVMLAFIHYATLHGLMNILLLFVHQPFFLLFLFFFFFCKLDFGVNVPSLSHNTGVKTFQLNLQWKNRSTCVVLCDLVQRQAHSRLKHNKNTQEA